MYLDCVPHKAADRIRNVALVGHRGCGKTSLHEAMLFEAGAVSRLGTVADGSHGLRPRARRAARAMSIDAALACFEHGGREINLIDTPGEPSFVADAIAALRVADAAVVVVNGVMGVEVHTERLWRRADAEGLARLVFVNMLDRERADFFRALDSLKAAFGPHVVATEIPIGAEHEVRGVIDLIDLKAFVYEGDGPGRGRGGGDPRGAARAGRGVPREADGRGGGELRRADGALPRGRGDRPRRDRARAEAGRDRGRLFPVTCGVATRNLGTGRLLEALVEDLPSPAMRGAVPASGRRARRSRSSPTRRGRWSPTSSRRSPTPTPAGSTSSASTGNPRLRLPGFQRHPG